MSSDITFALRQTYSFDVYPTAILGSEYKNVVVTAVMDRDMANREIDTQALHAQVYPFLPAGTPNDPAAYDYVKIRLTSGEVTILGFAWIKPETVVTVATSIITVRIPNVGASDVIRIRNALVQNGYNNPDISIS